MQIAARSEGEPLHLVAAQEEHVVADAGDVAAAQVLPQRIDVVLLHGHEPHVDARVLHRRRGSTCSNLSRRICRCISQRRRASWAWLGPAAISTSSTAAAIRILVILCLPAVHTLAACAERHLFTPRIARPRAHCRPRPPLSCQRHPFMPSPHPFARLALGAAVALAPGRRSGRGRADRLQHRHGSNAGCRPCGPTTRHRARRAARRTGVADGAGRQGLRAERPARGRAGDLRHRGAPGLRPRRALHRRRSPRTPTLGAIIVNELKKDFNTAASDTFHMVLDTFHDARNGYQFAINPAGARWDAQMANEGRENNANWDGIWDVKTRIADDGWYAEIRIPFKTLKFSPDDEQTWGVNFQRRLRRLNENSHWAPLRRIHQVSRVSMAGTRRRPARHPAGLEPAHQAVRVDERRPERTRRVDRRRLRRRHRREVRRDLGADLGLHREHRLLAGRGRRAAGQPHALLALLPREARLLPRELGRLPVRLGRSAAAAASTAAGRTPHRT